ncbi:hypothetical protein SANTM175S_07337 [Streptomyces antimycoticus]
MRGYVHAQDGNLERAERELRTAPDMLASKRAALFTVQVEVELAGRAAPSRPYGRRGGPFAAAAGPHPRRGGRGRPPRAGRRGGRGRADRGPRRGPRGRRPPAAGPDRGLERGDAEAAEEHYCAALSLLERTGAAGDLADFGPLLGDLLRREGRLEAAMDAYRTGLGHRAAPGTTTLGPAPAEPPCEASIGPPRPRPPPARPLPVPSRGRAAPGPPVETGARGAGEAPGRGAPHGGRSEKRVRPPRVGVAAA